VIDDFVRELKDGSGFATRANKTDDLWRPYRSLIALSRLVGYS